MSPHLAEIFLSICWSARVGPMFTTTIGFRSSSACSTIRYAEKTDRLVPKTSIPSLSDKKYLIFFTFCLGTLSPKKTMSGLSTPPQLKQIGASNFSISS